MAITRGASGEETNAPRRCETLKARPSSACAAVAPRQTITRGLANAISVSSHGRQAAISAPFGLAWMRRLPRGSHLKCFTTLVRYTRARSMPGLGQRAIEQLPGRTDERVAGDVFGIAGLFTDHHHRRSGGSLTEHGLRRPLVEIAGAAAVGRGTNALQRRANGNLIGDRRAGGAGCLAFNHVPPTRRGNRRRPRLDRQPRGDVRVARAPR